MIKSFCVRVLKILENMVDKLEQAVSDWEDAGTQKNCPSVGRRDWRIDAARNFNDICVHACGALALLRAAEHHVWRKWWTR